MLPNFNNNGSCYEIFSSATDIIKYWKQKGKITKEFEAHSKSYIYSLQYGGVSVFSIPINEKHSLQITNPCLLFQFILFNNKSFSIEIGIKDKTDTKRRFNLTSSIKEIESKSLYIKIPLNDYPLNIWTNVIIDLESLTQQYFKTQTFKTIDNIHISGCLKIRKIFSLKSKDEPLLRSVDMGKSIPVANLIFMDSQNLIKNDLKIIGINNVNINNVNIDSNNIRNVLNSPQGNHRSSNSPMSNNASKFSATSDINLNKHKKYYRKSNDNNNNNSNDLAGGLNITPINNFNRAQMENLSKKARDNVQNTKKFIKGLPNLNNVKNDIKYAMFKNSKINNIEKALGNTEFEENDSYNNSNKLINTNNKEKGKSLGKYVYKQQQNKKRNKSNNPYRTHKLNKKANETNDNSGNIDNKNISNKNVNKEDNNNMNNINININNKNINKEKKSNINKNNITPLKQKEKEITDKDKSNASIYYNKKEQEISMEEIHDSLNFQNNKNEEKNPTLENKFKFNNIGFSNSLVSKNSIKENKPENENKNNKYSNCGGLLDSKFDLNNIPVYDSIEEVAEWQVDLNTNQNNGVMDDVAKIGDKLIHLEPGKNHQNNPNENIEGDDFVELSSLLNKKDTLRPYTPPIEELVQVNPNKMKGDSYMKCSMDRKNGLMNTNRILKNYDNLIYNQEKGLFYDPKTNIYYDIKAK